MARQKEIRDYAPVKCSKGITIRASHERVWTVLTDIDKWASWNTEVSNVKLNGEPKPQTTFDWKTGGTKIHSTLHTVEPFTNFGWSGKALGTLATHNWTLTETNGQTTVFVEESMRGFLVSLLKGMFNRVVEKGMQKWLEALKKECENEPYHDNRFSSIDEPDFL